MSKKNREKNKPVTEEEAVAEVAEAEEAPAQEAPAADTPKEEAPKEDVAEKLQKQLAAEHDQYLRILAEYDNFRKRSRKEKDALYVDIKAETVSKFLPVFDDLARALAGETADEAYKKGVELTMAGLRKVMTGLGVEEFGEVGEPFDPNAHNAVMHIESEDLGENVIAQVFQKGFRIGEKVIRHAVVQVAN